MGAEVKRSVLTVTAVAFVLLIAALSASGCGGGGGTATTTGSKADAARVGVPVYPGTSPEEAYAGVYKMVTPDSFDKVVAFYKDKLPGATYSQITIPTGRGASFLVDDKDFHGNVSVEENLPASGKVTITVSRYSQ
jgi:hypothetical protein